MGYKNNFKPLTKVRFDKNKPLGFFAFFLFLVCFLPGCTPQKNQNNLPRLSIAFQSWVGYGPLYLAQEKGFFKKEGLELFFVDEQLDSARRVALKQGILDCEAGTLDLLVNKRDLDTSVVAVLELDYSFGADGIVAAENTKTLPDLLYYIKQITNNCQYWRTKWEGCFLNFKNRFL
jgi:ABC-type nitrate/sulfonate/bicarbonate transport system substrate-binding protein